MRNKTKSRTASSKRWKWMNNIPTPRVPQEFYWDILRSLAQDLQGYLHESFKDELDYIIRKKDVVALISLSEAYGLQCIPFSGSDTIAETNATYQIVALLKKFQFDDPNFDRRAAAIEKFLAAERQCSAANDVLLPKLRRTQNDDILSVFTLARGFIARVLGQIPDWDDVSRDCRHGPGATLSTSRGFNSSYFKYGDWPYDVTKAALPYAIGALLQDERWRGALEDDYRNVMEIPKHFIIDQQVFLKNVFHVVSGNFVTFVPKDVRQERTIAIEPTINLYLQLGVDGSLRRRLKAYGVDLDSQKKNQDLARIGSIEGSFSTLDLKQASDMLSTEACRYLFPPMWFGYLMALRSPVGDFEGNDLAYSKISSMGNGFTFAVESLVFTAIVYGVYKHYLGEFRHQHFAVYGDDIIVRSEVANMLVYYLKLIGFTVNRDKSFFTGFVRESCGTDWLKGHLIRPVFIDTPIDSLAALYSVRNRIRRKLEVDWHILDSKTVSLIDKWVPASYNKIVGPPSNEDFSSYRHVQRRECNATRVPNTYCWKIFFVKGKAGSVNGRKFLFRKLMHPLRFYEESPWHRKIHGGLKDGGSNFHVAVSNHVSWSISTRLVLEWPDYYLSD